MNSWTEIKDSYDTYGCPGLVDLDMNLMHRHYNVHEAISKLNNASLKEFLEFRFKFLQEELNEGLKAIGEKNPKEIVDSLIDMIVVAVGTLDLYDVDFPTAWYEVLKANMSKQVGVKEGRPNPHGLPDLIKPPGFINPDHTGNTGLLDKCFEES